MDLLYIISGLILLVAGRKLFWVCIALVGFLFGLELGGEFFATNPWWIRLGAGLAAGLVGALLAGFLQRLAFACAGFFAGFYLAIFLPNLLVVYIDSLVLCITGGVIGVMRTVGMRVVPRCLIPRKSISKIPSRFPGQTAGI